MHALPLAIIAAVSSKPTHAYPLPPLFPYQHESPTPPYPPSPPQHTPNAHRRPHQRQQRPRRTNPPPFNNPIPQPPLIHPGPNPALTLPQQHPTTPHKERPSKGHNSHPRPRCQRKELPLPLSIPCPLFPSLFRTTLLCLPTPFTPPSIIPTNFSAPIRGVGGVAQTCSRAHGRRALPSGDPCRTWRVVV